MCVFVMRSLACVLAFASASVIGDQSATAPRSGDGLFAVPFECPSRSACSLLGHLREGSVITLLSSKRSETCQPTVGKSSQIEDDVSEPYYLTEIALGRCPGFPFRLAWLGQPSVKYDAGPFPPSSNQSASLFPGRRVEGQWEEEYWIEE